MSWFSRCSWCGGPFNGGNCRHCTNVSFGDEYVRNPEPISNDETPDFSYPPSQTQTYLLDQWHCFHCKDPLEKGECCKRCSCKWCGSGLSEGFCFICASSNGNSSNNDLNPNNAIEIKDYRNEKIDIRFRRECEDMIDELKSKFNGMSIEINKKKELQRLEQVANLSTYPSQRFNSFCYDEDDDYDYEEISIPLRDIISKLPPSIAITPVLPTIEDPEDSLIMGNEELSTILENKLNEFIKSSV
ncbi:hypothetical protein Tco_0684393 [Tanacetum coccineum]